MPQRHNQTAQVVKEKPLAAVFLFDFCYNIYMIKRVGILRGGKGKHYTSSLKKGGEIISHIFENLAHKYKVVDILIDTEGNWHLNGMPIKPADLVHKVDVVWNVGHPSESVILNNFAIPNIGNSSFSTAMENSKDMLREHMSKIGIQMPRSIILPLYQEDLDGPSELYAIKKAKEVHEKFSAPWTIKSFTADSNMGIHLAKTFGELVEAIEDGVKHKKSILVEEFISGKVASVHSVPAFRGEDFYTFPLLNTFGIFSQAEKEKLDSLAKDLHQHADAKHYLKMDFIINLSGRVYLLGIDSTPDLNPGSQFAEACEQVGAKTHQVVEHILEQV
jgi:D-alanine-D-alanine ligase-like ATP-grasp enzyme